jgi:hypothetical protein
MGIVKDITDGIIGDITMRSGLGDLWDEIDDKTKEDIKKEWERIIMKELKCHL